MIKAKSIVLIFVPFMTISPSCVGIFKKAFIVNEVCLSLSFVSLFIVMLTVLCSDDISLKRCRVVSIPHLEK